MTDSVACLGCEYYSNKDDTFQDISLPLRVRRTGGREGGRAYESENLVIYTHQNIHSIFFSLRSKLQPCGVRVGGREGGTEGRRTSTTSHSLTNLCTHTHTRTAFWCHRDDHSLRARSPGGVLQEGDPGRQQPGTSPLPHLFSSPSPPSLPPSTAAPNAAPRTPARASLFKSSPPYLSLTLPPSLPPSLPHYR